MSTLQDLNQVLSRKQDILENAAGVEKQKKSGKLTARERVALLLDEGSFLEQSMLLSDAGVVTGSGTVEGRPVFVAAQDFAVMDGAVGAKQAKKIVKILDLARKTGTPVVLMCDSNGARVGEGAAALEAYTDIFAHMARLSGVVPMITMVLGLWMVNVVFSFGHRLLNFQSARVTYFVNASLFIYLVHHPLTLFFGAYITPHITSNWLGFLCGLIFVVGIAIILYEIHLRIPLLKFLFSGKPVVKRENDKAPAR